MAKGGLKVKVARALTTAAAMAEMVGDKMPFAPDRRIPPSFAFRLALGALGGWALAGNRAAVEVGALVGVTGAVAGTLVGRAARGGDSRTSKGRAWGLAEDVAALGLAALVVASAERQPDTARSAS